MLYQNEKKALRSSSRWELVPNEIAVKQWSCPVPIPAGGRRLVERERGNVQMQGTFLSLLETSKRSRRSDRRGRRLSDCIEAGGTLFIAASCTLRFQFVSSKREKTKRLDNCQEETTFLCSRVAAPNPPS